MVFNVVQCCSRVRTDSFKIVQGCARLFNIVQCYELSRSNLLSVVQHCSILRIGSFNIVQYCSMLFNIVQGCTRLRHGSFKMFQDCSLLPNNVQRGELTRSILFNMFIIAQGCSRFKVKIRIVPFNIVQVCSIVFKIVFFNFAISNFLIFICIF